MSSDQSKMLLRSGSQASPQEIWTTAEVIKAKLEHAREAQESAAYGALLADYCQAIEWFKAACEKAHTALEGQDPEKAKELQEWFNQTVHYSNGLIYEARAWLQDQQSARNQVPKESQFTINDLKDKSTEKCDDKLSIISDSRESKMSYYSQRSISSSMISKRIEKRIAERAKAAFSQEETRLAEAKKQHQLEMDRKEIEIEARRKLEDLEMIQLKSKREAQLGLSEKALREKINEKEDELFVEEMKKLEVQELLNAEAPAYIPKFVNDEVKVLSKSLPNMGIQPGGIKAPFPVGPKEELKFNIPPNKVKDNASHTVRDPPPKDVSPPPPPGLNSLALYKPPPRLLPHYSPLAIPPTSAAAHVPSQCVDTSLQFSNTGPMDPRFWARMQLPPKEITKFAGDPLKLNPFLLSFKNRVIELGATENELYDYLLQYTTGDAQELVETCASNDLAASYHREVDELNKHYGGDYRVCQSYLQKLEQWPSIPKQNKEELEKFSLFLKRCCNLMETMDEMAQLNSDRDIQHLAEKLPFELHKSWRDKYFDLKSTGKRITFKAFTEFVARKSEIISLPGFNRLNEPQWSKRDADAVHRKRGFSTQVNTGNKPQGKKGRDGLAKTVCKFCSKEGHTMEYCRSFLGKPWSKRDEFIKTNKLCFGCLRQGHTYTACKAKMRCKTCDRLHPTSMHREPKEAPKPEATATPTSEQANSTPEESAPPNASAQSHALKPSSNKGMKSAKRLLCPAILVKVSVPGSSKTVSTYMGLDTFSTDCFIDDELLDELNLKCKESSIQVSTMNASNKPLPIKLVKDLQISSMDGQVKCLIRKLYGKAQWPFDVEDAPRPSDLENCAHLKDIPIQFSATSLKIGILIGMDHPELLYPMDAVRGPAGQPFATMHKLGWALNGLVANRSSAKGIQVHHIYVEHQEDLRKRIDDLYAQDFVDNHFGEKAPSIDDKAWEDKISSSYSINEQGQTQMQLPFRKDIKDLPNNYCQVYCRIKGLTKKFDRNPQLKEDYVTFMDELISKGYMERVPQCEIDGPSGKVWYLTHHSVYHKQKKKIRVVFDCSLKFQGESQNDRLLQGPDLTNNLVGILIRFREYPVAASGDIEKMFLQVKVPKADAELQRILWYPDSQVDKYPVPYRLNTHVFGSVSSPSCANFALRKTVDINPTAYSYEAKDSILKAFYVDDFLKSTSTENQMSDLIKEVRRLVSEGGFNLTGFISNSRKVLDSIPNKHLAKGWRELDLAEEELPRERALGIIWMTESDSFGFRVNFEDKPPTRRGILSTVASVYDPLGLAAPIIVSAKLIFQQSCQTKDWDTPITGNLLKEWKLWVDGIKMLVDYKIPRYIGADVGEASRRTLHIFCDGSERAYGAVAYARCQNGNENVSTCFVMAKTRLVPRNSSTVKTIPRIELNAAKLAVQLYLIIKRESTLEFGSVTFWSDSMAVLSYLNNTSTRFQRFIAHRIEFIHQYTNCNQWRHVPGEINIADILTKGYSVENFRQNENWKKGPSFLEKKEIEWPTNREVQFPESEFELKKEPKSFTRKVDQNNVVDKLLASTNDWKKLKLRVAGLRKFFDWLKNKDQLGPINVQEIEAAETSIFKYVQLSSLSEEVKVANEGKLQSKDSPLRKLKPILGEDKLLRVGGRLSQANISVEACNPIIFPKEHPITNVLIWHHHLLEGHMGKLQTTNSLHQRFWIIGGVNKVKAILDKCIVCKKKNARPTNPEMADLPTDRVTPDNPPFYSTGIDFFGPFKVKLRRSLQKRYGVVFSCLASRAIHLEVADSLDMDSFLNAFQRFRSRRGTPRIVHSDNGTNLVAGSESLKEELDKWERKNLVERMMLEYIEWKFNPPSGSHFGGVYEREIRSARNVLQSILLEQQLKVNLNDDSLNTLFCQVEEILNNRPMIPLSDDPNDLQPLTPNHLLRLETSIPFPPCVTDESQIYGRRRWKQVQYLADLFWSRWTKEYLPTLQKSQKWLTKSRPYQVGDLVLIVDQLLPRNQWCLGRVVTVLPSHDGIIRRAHIKVARCRKENKLAVGTTILERPTSKLILLQESEAN